MKILVNDFGGHPFQIQLSRELARCGHSVLHTFFADNNSPRGATCLRRDDPLSLSIEALSISRPFRKHSVLWRRFADIAYGKAVSERVRAFRPDVVLSSNMPLDAQKILLHTAREIGARFVFWLQDLLSSAIEYVLRRKRLPFASWAGQMYATLERRLLCESDAVVCIAPEFREALRRSGVPESKMFVIENWAPLDEICLMPHDTEWAREQGIAGKFCFMYSGTLGMKHKPELLLHLARQFKSDARVVTVVIAEGAGMDWLRNHANVSPESLLLLRFQPYQRISEVLATAHVLITLLDQDCGAFAVPSKTLAYLCAGRPLLVAAPNENLAARIVRRATAGEVVDPLATDMFVCAAERLFADELAREAYGTNARTYAERRFAIGEIAQEFITIFDPAMSRPGITKTA